MTKQLVVALLLLIPVAPLAAQLEDADAQTRAKCTEYLKTPLPAEALATATPKAWPECESYKSYSGLGEKWTMRRPGNALGKSGLRFRRPLSRGTPPQACLADRQCWQFSLPTGMV